MEESEKQQFCQAVGDHIREEAAAEGLSQRAIAERMGIKGMGTVVRAMAGGNLKLASLFEIARAINRRPKVLLLADDDFNSEAAKDVELAYLRREVRELRAKLDQAAKKGFA